MNIDWIGELFDTLVIVLGKYGAWLNARGNRICFIIGSIVLIYWFVIDVYRDLYAQAISCFISWLINIYGWFKWEKKVK